MKRKLIGLIKNGEFAEADKLIVKCSGKDVGDISFEKAYVCYRLNRDENALQALSEMNATEQRALELKAQIFYRTDRFEEAYDLLLSVMKNSDDDCDQERQTNLLAIAAKLESQGKGKQPKIKLSSFEQYYNHACCLIEREQFEEAQQMLEEAEAICRDVCAEDGLTEEDTEEEVSIIVQQKAYVMHMAEKLGKSPKAAPLINVDELEEQIFVPRGNAARPRKEFKKEVADTEIVTGKLNVRRRTRKVILPKNINPSVKPDPERWLPRQERSAYKRWLKKHKDHDVGRGTQGTVSSATVETFDSSPAQSPSGHNAPEGPRKQGPSAQQAKKKNNKKKGKK